MRCTATRCLASNSTSDMCQTHSTAHLEFDYPELALNTSIEYTR